MVVGRAGIGLDNVDVEAATAPRRDGGQRPAEQHRLGGRAHDGAAAGPGAQRAPGPRRAGRRPLGAQPLGGRRARRQDPRHRRPRPHRQARRRPGQGLRDAPHRLRPVRVGRPGAADGRRAAAARPGRRRVRLPHDPPAEDARRRSGLIGRDLLLKAKPIAARDQRRPRRHRRRDGAGRGHPRRRHRRRRARRVRVRADDRRRRCSSSTSVVVTPHLGASTREAQDKAGDTIADMVQLALAGEFVPFAVNVDAAEAQRDAAPVPARSPSASARLFASLVGELPTTLEICAEGDIAGYDTRILGLVGAEGLLRRRHATSRSPTSTPRSWPRTAASRCARSTRHVGRLRQPDHAQRRRPLDRPARSPGGAASSASCMIDGHTFDVPPADHMLVVTNDDRPGVIGTVGTLLGDAGVNIADMDVGRVRRRAPR